MNSAHKDHANSKDNQNVLENMLNSMDTSVYVTDLDTDEILFANDKLRTQYTSPSGKLEGEYCWRMFQGLTERCPFCPIHHLLKNPDETVVWEGQSPINGRHFRNSDRLIRWSDGRLVHMQNAVDITDTKVLAEAQQELMSKISQRFILGTDFDQMVYDALTMIGEFMGYSRVALLMLDEQAHELNRTHEWLADQDMETPYTQVHFGSETTLYNLIVREKRTVVIQNNVGKAGNNSVLSMPIYLKDRLLGMLEFSMANETHLWESSDKHLAEFLTGAAAGVLDRRQTQMSFEKQNTLFERVMQPIVYIDTKEEVTYYNDATFLVFGYTEKELLDGGLVMLFGETTYERVRTHVWPKAFQEGIIEVDLPLIHKNGNIRIFSFLGVVINIPGELPELATIGTDITDLVDAKEAAVAVSQAKSEFLARMSHEIRTPMNAIIGMTSIAQESDDPARKAYCLDKISSASKHLLGVINDILDMSKIEANKFEISTEEFDFEKMLMNITNMVGFRMDEKNHNFVVNFDPTITHYIIGDEQRLSQVIVNLLSNAVKFTPERGTIALSIDCIEISNKEMKLRFVVSDTGIGISPEQQSKLFSSFEQADGSISRRFGGTGLGLAISKRIIELMGGEIFIKSQLGIGTDVVFDIVVKKGNQKQRSRLSKKIDKQCLRILAVDDSTTTREYFLHLMRQLGLDCQVASSGEDALSKIENAAKEGNPYNFFFVDWMMPDMDGIELAEMIRSKTPKDTIVIMISAARWADVEARATQVGIDGFISKPLFPSVLVNCINNCLGFASDTTKKADTSTSDTDFSNYNLLLVEDVDVNREIVQALLAHTNIQIDTAENGIEALERINTGGDKYDLIFMDIHMPIMDGYEATREIRKRMQDGRQIPIIAMTANAFKEDIERCKASGMNDHIAKPLDKDTMLNKMKIWLKPR